MNEPEFTLSGVDFIKYYCERFKGQSVSVKDVFGATTVTGTYSSSDGITFTVTAGRDIYIYYKSCVRYIEVDNEAAPTTLTIYL